MQAVPGCPAAQPFVTRHQALGCDFYLRIALELYLKRLLVGGIDKVFEIGRNFRNEGLSRKHNPEFTMLEAYQAYGDYESMMELVQGLVCHVAENVLDTLVIEHPRAPEVASALMDGVRAVEDCCGVLGGPNSPLMSLANKVLNEMHRLLPDQHNPTSAPLRAAEAVDILQNAFSEIAKLTG